MALKGYYSANEVISEALLRVGDAEQLRFAEAAMYFVSAHRDFQLYHSTDEKQAWVTVNALNNTFLLPEDCVKVLSVGVSVNREFFSFTKSDSMTQPSDVLDSQLLSDRDENDNISRAPYSGYGARALNVEYYYTVDSRKRRVILSRAAVNKTRFADRNEVLIKYVSQDIESLESTKVAVPAVNMIIAYIEWKLISARPNEYPANYRAEKKQDFLESEAMYRLLSIPDIDELMDVIYDSSGQNVRI